MMDFEQRRKANEMDAGQAWGGPQNDARRLTQADEQGWLMSLALDGELDEAEAARLEELLAKDGDCQADWQRWLALDEELRRVPCVLPPPDFASRFDSRLALWERRRKLRMGVLFGLAALAIWTSALLGVIGLGVFFWANQVEWMTGAVNQMTLWWLVLTSAVETIVSGARLLLGSPQVWMVVVCYLALAAAILSGWFAWLRRSLRLLPSESR